MLTLKKDGIHEKLLLETLAFIASHTAMWNQGSWRNTEIENNRCKTPMCFAGHTAISLRGGTDAIPLPKVRVFNAVERDTATEEERNHVQDWWNYSDYLKPTPAEIRNGDAVELELEDGTTIKGITISDRARNLLGDKAVFDKKMSRDLFSGNNSLEEIVAHIAKVTGKTPEQVEEAARKIAKANKWRIPADGFKDK